MRFDRKCDSFFDNLFWFIIYAFPLLLLFKADFDLTAFNNLVLDLVPLTNPIYDLFVDIFGLLGFNLVGDFFLLFLSYFISITIMHLVVDVILFLFRAIHNFLARYEK